MLVFAFALAGCSNPDAAGTASVSSETSPQNTGEPQAPGPPAAAAQAPADVRSTPAGAIAAFAARYVNWDYRTLAADQRTLAAMAVGAARLSEQQAAVSSASDSTITRGRIWNSGQLVSVAPDRARQGIWVLVTRERTGGDSQYEGLPATYHVTLAQLARVPNGFAVSQWLPQN
jgi:hypothetical protein